MFNPYTIVLGLFVVAGFLGTLWGLRIILIARKTRLWPRVEGVIEEAKISSDVNDLLPKITFSYTVADHPYRAEVQFPADVTPSQQYANQYIEKYPQGHRVQVYYDPENPQRATLEPGMAQGDWLVFAIGLGMLIFGILFLLVGH